MTPDGQHLKQLIEDNRGIDTDPVWFDPIAWSVYPVANFVTIWGEIKKPMSGR